MRKNIPPQLPKKSGGIFSRESLSPIDESAAPLSLCPAQTDETQETSNPKIDSYVLSR